MTLPDKVWESFYEQVKVWVHFLICTKKKHFVLQNCTLTWSEFFIPFHLTWKFEIKVFWKFSFFSFSERKGINFCCVQIIYLHLLTLNYPLQYAKRVSNIFAKEAAAMYAFVVWVISWTMWVYNTTQGFLLVSCYWYKGCNIISNTLNKFVLVLFHSHLGM